MRLTLDRIDLRPEHQKINCSRTRFEHFRPTVQQAIRIVGRAQFIEWDGENYNAIYPDEADQ